MSTSETVSVVIRVRNEEAPLRTVLDALDAQDLRPAEIIVVDNQSTDHSNGVARQHGAKLLEISRAEFTYGRALNMGIRHASGEFICILSAHSLPIGPGFLRSAIAPFDDPTVAAARCLSVTNRKELERWAQPIRLEWPVEIDAVFSSAPANCASIIRRSVWEQIPYDETIASLEDKFWAFQVLQAGYRICGSTALYLYLRDFGLNDKLRTLHRDRLVFYKQTGRQWQEPPVSLLRLLANAFYNIPRRALRSAFYEAALYAFLRAIPYQARRKQKVV